MLDLKDTILVVFVPSANHHPPGKIMDNVSFKVSREVSTAINLVATRYQTVRTSLGLRPVDGLSLNMDLTACHANGCPMDWERLNAADDFTLSHDVGGIQRHINRRTGKLEDCFLPKCAA